MRTSFPFFIAVAAAIAAPAAAQLLPGVGGTVRDVVGPLRQTLEPVEQRVTGTLASAQELADIRTRRLARMVRANRSAIELDADGEPARRGELLLVGAGAPELALAQTAGFVAMDEARMEELGLTVVRVRVPADMSLAKAQRALEHLLPGATVTADHLHFASGNQGSSDQASPAARRPRIDVPVGMIDGAPGAAVRVEEARGFARGAPHASHHGSAIASLLRGVGVRRILVADVYGTDPAGGNAMAIARGIDWLLSSGVRVISISLVGPRNPVLERAIAAARRKGATLVAAVGNDGPAAPPSYPASYSGVLAITGVDSRNRVLIEAGRALHLDYAAPGADMIAANAAGKWTRVRGTSYAVPLVAARTAAALSRRESNPVLALDREAVDLGAKGPDRVYGRGLLCGRCRQRQ